MILISFCDALKIFCCFFYDIALAVVIRTVWVFITDFAVDIKRYFLYRITDRLSRNKTVDNTKNKKDNLKF